MAISESILLKELSGRIGHELVFKQWGNKTIVTKYPNMSKRKLSKKQKQVNEMMEEANYEAKRVIADEKLKNVALLRLNVTRNKLYTSLIREYFQIARQSM
jgi:ribosome biogenesis SPOUT family RNA methylase Rps3